MHRTHGNGQPIDERVDFFFSAPLAGDPRLVETDKAADLRWFALDALCPTRSYPHELSVISTLLDVGPRWSPSASDPADL